MSPIGALDVLHEDLRQTLHIPYLVKRYSSNAPLCSPPRPQHAVNSRPSSRISLPPDLDTFVIGEIDVFHKGGAVERKEVKEGEGASIWQV